MAKVCWIVVGPPPVLTRLPKGSSTALTFSSMTPKSETKQKCGFKENVTNGAEYSGQFDEIKNNKNVLVFAMWFLLAEVSTDLCLLVEERRQSDKSFSTWISCFMVSLRLK